MESYVLQDGVIQSSDGSRCPLHNAEYRGGFRAYADREVSGSRTDSERVLVGLSLSGHVLSSPQRVGGRLLLIASTDGSPFRFEECWVAGIQKVRIRNPEIQNQVR